jgi:hypothetical protein
MRWQGFCACWIAEGKSYSGVLDRGEASRIQATRFLFFRLLVAEAAVMAELCGMRVVCRYKCTFRLRSLIVPRSYLNFVAMASVTR